MKYWLRNTWYMGAWAHEVSTVPLSRRLLGAHDTLPLEHCRESFIQTFEHEDKPMIEDVAEAMGYQTDLLAMKPALLRSDAP